MEKITDMLLCQVVNESGENLGRVFELRSAGEPEHGLHAHQRKITEILYGKRAFLETLGLKDTELACVSMDEVIGIEPGRIIVPNTSKRG